MLPPISGGSPDATSPEAEVEVPAGASSSPVDTGSTAVLNQDEGEGRRERPDIGSQRRLPSGQPKPSSTRAPSHATIRSWLRPEASGRFRAGVRRNAAAEHGGGRAGRTGEPAEPAAASEPGRRRIGHAPRGPRPPRPPKQGGQGKSDSSRSRSSRPRHGPPPPPEPPRPHPADAQLAQLAYVVVNEAGASVYSTSQVGRDELPDLDATLRSGISIGRRLQDPLAELVKIEPQNIGVGLYQHDVNPKQLKETLESVIASCVNFVGVDLNTASVPLLRHVSGLNQLTARRIVDYRKEHGPFANREQLTQVEGVGPATFTQAAGFLKIPDGENPLDRTWIHPESYPAAIKLLEKLEFAPDVVRDKARLPELNEKLATADLGELSRELEVGEFTLRDILEALGRPERDPREDLPKPIFKKGILKIEDLSRGHGAQGDGLECRGLWRVRRHRPQGFGAGAYQSARQSVCEEPARCGERGRRGDGLGHGSRPGTETGLADDGQARDGAPARASKVAVLDGGRGPGRASRRGSRQSRTGQQGRRGRRWCRRRSTPASTGGLGIDIAPGRFSLGGRACREPGRPQARARPRRSAPGAGGPRFSRQ